MPNEHPDLHVIHERVNNLIKDYEQFKIGHRESKKILHDKINSVEKDLKEEMSVMDAKVDDITTSHGRIESVLSRMADDVKTLIDDSKKDKGWREVLLDFIKALVYIGGVIGAMKWFT